MNKGERERNDFNNHDSFYDCSGFHRLELVHTEVPIEYIQLNKIITHMTEVERR